MLLTTNKFNPSLQASYWREYCELEIESGSPETVKTLFSRCLLTCLDIDLWRTYLRFIRRINDPVGAEGLAEVRQSYEFALDHIGQDTRSGPVWQDYIQFLAAPKPGTVEYNALYGAASEGQEDSQRTAALRRAYHRALLVPNAALDPLWTGYERFENGTGNKQLAKRALDEWRPRFQAARGLVKDRSAKLEPLDLRALPLPPGRGGARRAQQAAGWRKFLEWERSNLQELDPGSYQARVVLAYEQALTILLLYPDVWLDFASWHSVGGGAGPAAAKEVLHRGRKVLPAAISLHFAAAEAEEAAGAMDKVKEIYEELVESLTARGTPAIKKEAAATNGDAEDNQEGKEEPPAAPLLGPKSGTLVWIHYMRFARRSNGMMAARKLFLRARKYPALCWEAFAASAAMEWATEGKDQIPRNIFELGLKTYLSEPEYVLTYADFLQGLGDTANTRSLFERALTATPVEAVGPLFDAYLQLEAASGSLAAVATLEQRRRDVLGALVVNNALDPAHVAQLKYNYMGLSSGLEIGLAQAGVAPAISFLPRGSAAAAAAAGAGAESDVGGAGGDGAGDDRRRSTRRRGRSRSRSRSPPSTRKGDSEQPIRHFPRELGQLVNQVRGPPDGPVPDNEKIIDVIMRMDFSPEGIEAHESAAARERKRQRRNAQGPPGAAGSGDGGGAAGFGVGGKRKAEHGMQPPPMIDSESGDSSGDDDDGEGAGLDVYRRRMRSRV